MDKRSLQLPITYQDAADHGRILLRDGSVASLRLSKREDYQAIRAFYQRLSPESRKLRFFSEAKPGEDVIESMCDSSDPHRCMTLLVWRTLEGADRIIATGSYIAQDETTAEFAVAVDDRFHGKGLGGTILERLSAMAVTNGFTRFFACTHMSNRMMLDVFRHSGYELQEQAADGTVDVTFSVIPDEKNVSHALQRDRLFTKASIRPFFHPSAVAVIGTSQDEHSVGVTILENLNMNGFSGRLYAVNPSVDIAAGVQVLHKVEELPEGIDLAIISVPVEYAESVVDACAKRLVRSIIITTSGYAETGTAGREREESLLEKVRGYGMRLLGPNSLGIMNTDPAVNLNASLSTHYPRNGSVALSSQSGALGMTLLQIAQQRNIGLSMFASMGNKADVTGNDLLYFWEDDASTDVILLYLESFGNPLRFGRIAREVSRRKPIVCVKSGSYRSTREEHAVSALFEQAGVIRVRTIEEMFDAAVLLGSQPLPGGGRVSIITNSRGAGVLCADACVNSGLEIAYLSPGEKKPLAAQLAPGASLEGIIDLSSSATHRQYREAIRSVMTSTHTDALILIFTPLTAAPKEPVLDALSDVIAEFGDDPKLLKPVITVMMSDTAGTVIHHQGCTFPCFQFPEKAAHTLAAANRYRMWRDTPAGSIPVFSDIDIRHIRGELQTYENRDAEGWISTEAVSRVIAAAGIPVVSEDRSDAASLDVSVSQHALFGPVLSFGDMTKTYRMIPLTDQEAQDLTVHAPIPDTVRPELTEAILRLSFLIEEIPMIEELSVSINVQSKIIMQRSKLKICV